MKKRFSLSLQFFGDPEPAPAPAPAPEPAPAPAPAPAPKPAPDDPLTLEEITAQYKADVDALKAQIKDRDNTIRLLLNGDDRQIAGGKKPPSDFEKMLRI